MKDSRVPGLDLKVGQWETRKHHPVNKGHLDAAQFRAVMWGAQVRHGIQWAS